MALGSTIAPVAVQRHGDVLRTRDGTLRAVVECAACTSPDLALSAATGLRHPAQVVLRSRRAAITEDAHRRDRLRASQAILLSGLVGRVPAFIRRVFVIVREEAADRVSARLDEIGLDPVRLTGRDLAAIAMVDIVSESRCEVRAGEAWARTLIVTRSPDRVSVGDLDAIDFEYDLSVHVLPVGRSDLVEQSAYLTLWAATRGSLDVATERAEAMLTARGIRTRRPYLQAVPALASAMPLGLDLIQATRVVPQPAIVERAAEHRILYGADPGTARPLTLDRLALPNPNALILGGAEERSRVLALELVRARLDGLDVHVIDGSGRYAQIVSALDGRSVAPTDFDAMSVPKGPNGCGLESRIRTLLAVVELIAGGLAPADFSAIEDALAFVYASRGHTQDGAGDDAPTLGEIVAALTRRAGGKSELATLAHALERHVAGAGGRLFQRRHSPLALGRLSVHDLTRTPSDVRPAAALLSLDRLWHDAPSDRRSLLLLDGVDAMLHDAAAEILRDVMAASVARKWGLTVATHDVAAVLCGPLRPAALDAGLTVLLRQEPAVIESLADAFRLTPAEQSWLLDAAPDEGLLIADGRRLAFRAVASDEEERLISGGTR